MSINRNMVKLIMICPYCDYYMQLFKKKDKVVLCLLAWKYMYFPISGKTKSEKIYSIYTIAYIVWSHKYKNKWDYMCV